MLILQELILQGILFITYKNDRKEWSTNFMEGQRQHRLHGLPEDSCEGDLGKEG